MKHFSTVKTAAPEATLQQNLGTKRRMTANSNETEVTCFEAAIDAAAVAGKTTPSASFVLANERRTVLLLCSLFEGTKAAAASMCFVIRGPFGAKCVNVQRSSPPLCDLHRNNQQTLRLLLRAMEVYVHTLRCEALQIVEQTAVAAAENCFGKQNDGEEDDKDLAWAAKVLAHLKGIDEERCIDGNFSFWPLHKNATTEVARLDAALRRNAEEGHTFVDVLLLTADAQELSSFKRHLAQSSRCFVKDASTAPSSAKKTTLKQTKTMPGENVCTELLRAESALIERLDALHEAIAVFATTQKETKESNILRSCFANLPTGLRQLHVNFEKRLRRLQETAVCDAAHLNTIFADMLPALRREYCTLARNQKAALAKTAYMRRTDAHFAAAFGSLDFSLEDLVACALRRLVHYAECVERSEQKSDAASAIVQELRQLAKDVDICIGEAESSLIVCAIPKVIATPAQWKNGCVDGSKTAAVALSLWEDAQQTREIVLFDLSLVFVFGAVNAEAATKKTAQRDAKSRTKKALFDVAACDAWCEDWLQERRHATKPFCLKRRCAHFREPAATCRFEVPFKEVRWSIEDESNCRLRVFYFPPDAAPEHRDFWFDVGDTYAIKRWHASVEERRRNGAFSKALALQPQNIVHNSAAKISFVLYTTQEAFEARPLKSDAVLWAAGDAAVCQWEKCVVPLHDPCALRVCGRMRKFLRLPFDEKCAVETAATEESNKPNEEEKEKKLACALAHIKKYLRIVGSCYDDLSDQEAYIFRCRIEDLLSMRQTPVSFAATLAHGAAQLSSLALSLFFAKTPSRIAPSQNPSAVFSGKSSGNRHSASRLPKSASLESPLFGGSFAEDPKPASSAKCSITLLYEVLREHAARLPNSPMLFVRHNEATTPADSDCQQQAAKLARLMRKGLAKRALFVCYPLNILLACFDAAFTQKLRQSGRHRDALHDLMSRAICDLSSTETGDAEKQLLVRMQTLW